MYLLVNGFGNNGPKVRRTRLESPLTDASKVSDLRASVATQINQSPDSFVLMHCGVSIKRCISIFSEYATKCSKWVVLLC